LANGQTIATLGKINIDIETDEGLEIPMEVEVIDSATEDFIIGNDTLGNMNANIDYKHRLLTLESDDGIIDIPVRFIPEMTEQDEEYFDSDEEQDFEYEYEYEEGDRRQLYTIFRTDENDDNFEMGVKELVLAP
jgi:hypothetical protein